LKAQDFYVQKTGAAVPAGGMIEAEFFVGLSSTVICTIPAGGTSCTGPASPISVPAGSQISIQVRTFGGDFDSVPGYDLLFGWRATS
jgi:hypothetical protein